jgi:hypothetical protein
LLLQEFGIIIKYKKGIKKYCRWSFVEI